LVWFILATVPRLVIIFWCFNSTVGLIYTVSSAGKYTVKVGFQFHCWSDLYLIVVEYLTVRASFQFHCWSDLYRIKDRHDSSTSNVSIPLLVWFILQTEKDFTATTGFQFHCWSDLYEVAQDALGYSAIVSIPLLVWFIRQKEIYSEMGEKVSIPLLVWFILELIEDEINRQTPFQFHCWSDLYIKYKI